MARARFAPLASAQIARGLPGKKLAALQDWLYGADSHLLRPPARSRTNDKIKLRGIEISLEKREIFQTARRAMQIEFKAATSYQSWFVPIAEHRIAPKWLVSQLTGLPVGAFHSDEARRVLSHLGVKVQRV